MRRDVRRKRAEGERDGDGDVLVLASVVDVAAVDAVLLTESLLTALAAVVDTASSDVVAAVC